MVGRLYSVDMIKDWLSTAPTAIMAPLPAVPERRAVSLAAILTVIAPFGMVTISIFAFLIGFLLYYGMVFTRKLDGFTERYAGRDVFICLTVATGFCYLLFSISISGKDFESLIVNQYTTQADDDLLPRRDGDTALNEQEHGTKHMEVQKQPAKIKEDHQPNLAFILALEAASKAREQAAEADQEVANIYREMSQKLRDP